MARARTIPKRRCAEGHRQGSLRGSDGSKKADAQQVVLISKSSSGRGLAKLSRWMPVMAAQVMMS